LNAYLTYFVLGGGISVEMPTLFVLSYRSCYHVTKPTSPQNTNKHIRITQSKPSQVGWLWSRLPVTAANFEIEVEFKIGGDSTHLFGDGLAMWLTTTRAQAGTVFGSVGRSAHRMQIFRKLMTVLDEFNGLGIFIDT
jgi:mannose-binding lectin 2